MADDIHDCEWRSNIRRTTIISRGYATGTNTPLWTCVNDGNIVDTFLEQDYTDAGIVMRSTQSQIVFRCDWNGNLVRLMPDGSWRIVETGKWHRWNWPQ